LIEILITEKVKDGDGMHGQIMAQTSDKHNKHHSIYEMGKLQHKLKSEFKTHKIARTQFGEREGGGMPERR
jgi:hypothetical protein